MSNTRVCKICGEPVPERKKGYYCSQECEEEALPKCVTCKAPIKSENESVFCYRCKVKVVQANKKLLGRRIPTCLSID